MNDIEEILTIRYKEISELINDLFAEEKANVKPKPSFTTMKASVFLIFYNLIESVIYTAFECLFDEISCNCFDYNQLTPEVQKQYKKYDRNNNMNPNSLIGLSLKSYEGQVTLFSGNLDARLIRGLLSEWGIYIDFHMDKEEKLRDIKGFRNTLAHGEKAFKEIGRNYTMREISKYSTAIYNYLAAFVNCFIEYIQNKRYLQV